MPCAQAPLSSVSGQQVSAGAMEAMAGPGGPARAGRGPGQGHICFGGWTRALPPGLGSLCLHHTRQGLHAQ